jgi:hypothetical protein
MGKSRTLEESEAVYADSWLSMAESASELSARAASTSICCWFRAGVAGGGDDAAAAAVDGSPEVVAAVAVAGAVVVVVGDAGPAAGADADAVAGVGVAVASLVSCGEAIAFVFRPTYTRCGESEDEWKVEDYEYGVRERKNRKTRKKKTLCG